MVTGYKWIFGLEIFFISCLYPTALKGCQGVVFTHGVRIGRQVGGRKKFVWAVSQKP